MKRIVLVFLILNCFNLFSAAVNENINICSEIVRDYDCDGDKLVVETRILNYSFIQGKLIAALLNIIVQPAETEIIIIDTKFFDELAPLIFECRNKKISAKQFFKKLSRLGLPSKETIDNLYKKLKAIDQKFVVG